MKNYFHWVLIAGIFCMVIACQTTKEAKGNASDSNDAANKEDELMFDCYHASDTLDALILYFPEEKNFFVSNLPGTKEELCATIQYDININKGVKYYYHPQSNFLYLMTIVREVERCYNVRIDELSMEKFSKNYEQLSPEQKEVIDARLSYRVLSE